MCTNPLIILYDKGGTVEVYGECFELIGLFCLPLLHVSIIFETPTSLCIYKNTRSGLARHVMGTIFLVIMSNSNWRASEASETLSGLFN